jgi:hypothetical protein
MSMTWVNDYTGHHTAEGREHTYTITRSNGWDVVVLDGITGMVLGRHHESRKSAAIAVAARYEAASDAEQREMRREFRA